MATHSSILAWRITKDRGAWRAIVHRVAKKQTQLKPLSTHMHMGEKPSPGGGFYRSKQFHMKR